MVRAQVKAVREDAARREAALQAQIDEARSAAAAAAGGGAGGDGGDLASLLAAKEAELENLQAALGELSYEVGRGGMRGTLCCFCRGLWCSLSPRRVGAMCSATVRNQSCVQCGAWAAGVPDMCTAVCCRGLLQAEAAERARAELRGLKDQLAAAAAQQEAAAAAMQGE
jgi:hypothetical protein